MLGCGEGSPKPLGFRYLSTLKWLSPYNDGWLEMDATVHWRVIPTAPKNLSRNEKFQRNARDMNHILRQSLEKMEDSNSDTSKGSTVMCEAVCINGIHQQNWIYVFFFKVRVRPLISDWCATCQNLWNLLLTALFWDRKKPTSFESTMLLRSRQLPGYNMIHSKYTYSCSH